jgi:hypothetical protein
MSLSEQIGSLLEERGDGLRLVKVGEPFAFVSEDLLPQDWAFLFFERRCGNWRHGVYMRIDKGSLNGDDPLLAEVVIERACKQFEGMREDADEA